MRATSCWVDTGTRAVVNGIRLDMDIQPLAASPLQLRIMLFKYYTRQRAFGTQPVATPRAFIWTANWLLGAWLRSTIADIAHIAPSACTSGQANYIARHRRKSQHLDG